jgi:glycosyltransferase involved in cell wall biosynthesis
LKQVWILNHYAQVPGGAGGTRHFHLAEHLNRNGWAASIIAASVDSISGAQRLLPDETERVEKIGDVSFLWVRTPVYLGNGGGRILNMLAYTWRCLLKKTTNSLPLPDVVVGSSVHPFAALAGMLLARRFKVPFVFEVRDLWPQTLIDMGRLSENSLVTWLLRKLEILLYKKSTRIIVLLPFASEYIVPLGIPLERIVWIPNGVDLSLFPHSNIADLPVHEQFTLMYFGAHGQANGLENLLKAMRKVEDSLVGGKVVLRMIGDGPSKAALMLLAEQLNLKSVIFEPSVAKHKIPFLAAQADAFVIAVRDIPNLYRYGISMNKLFDYLAAQRPIILASAAANNPVEEAGCGITVIPDDSDELSKAIVKMADLPVAERMRMALAGREYVEKNHSFEILTSKLAGVLSDVSKRVL